MPDRLNHAEILTLAAAIFGPPPSPAEEFLHSKEFVHDPEVGNYFEKLRAEIGKIDPATVDSFVVTIMVKAPEVCAGCGENHGGLMQIGGVAGDKKTLRAQILLACDRVGLD